MMSAYIGTKIINAEAMNRLAYNEFRGWDLPSDEDGTDEGYLVEYMDGGEPNTKTHAGYVSWSPKAQFEGAYRITNGLNFGLALEALKKGMKVARKGWNGKGMWLVRVPGSENVNLVEGTPYRNAGLDRPITIDAHIDMYTAKGTMQPGWLASQSDMFADDWMLVE
jgi:hypothetical protein